MSHKESVSRGVSPALAAVTNPPYRVTEHRWLDAYRDQEQGFLGDGLPFALHRQRHGQNEVVERVIDVDLITEIASLAALADD
jgi:hypothetical protein